jgi:hypothetical protein
MAQMTFISDRTREAEAEVDSGRLLVEVRALPEAIGWELKPEGLCRDDACVPARDLSAGGPVDIAAVAAALGRQCVVDADARVAAIALDAETRRQALDALHAPAFALPDLDGVVHHLSEWSGRKKLLIAFSSW